MYVENCMRNNWSETNIQQSSIPDIQQRFGLHDRVVPVCGQSNMEF